MINAHFIEQMFRVAIPVIYATVRPKLLVHLVALTIFPLPPPCILRVKTIRDGRTTDVTDSIHICMYAIKCYSYSDDHYSTPSDLRRPLSNILIRLSSFEPAGGIMQAASLNCLVTKRHVAWSRNCRCAGVRSRVDNDFYSFV